MSQISKNNTVKINEEDGSISVILHSTKVIRHWPELRKVRLDNGGYDTRTTRTRINQAFREWNIPASIGTKNGDRQGRGGDTTISIHAGAEIIATHGFNGSVCEFNY